MYLPSTAPELIDLLAESGILAPQYLEQIRSQVPPPGTPGHEPKEFLATLVRQQILTPYQAKRLLAGQTGGYFIGRYRILELIGAGGMGKVYLAEQVTMKRPVALKLLPSKGSAHASGLARFMREARAVAKLRHTNIATAYDFDQEGDIYYIAMEYVEGLDVQELVKKIGPIPWPQACHLICQAANGLDHARQNGLVHRDIKPGNLMVEPTGILKILDLGLVVFHAEKDSLTLADKDVILGTADYIAPEQAIDSHDVDTRADIYSLGGVLYYMLTGQPPFPDKSVTQKLLLHQMKDPRPVKELAPDVPDEVAAVLQKMMAKQREDRFQKPRDVREALLRFAKQAKLFDSSLVRFPRETIEQYIRYGGSLPAPGASGASGKLARTLIEKPSPGSGGSSLVSKTDTHRPDAGPTQVLPKEKPAGADSSAGPPTLKTKKKRKKKKAKQAMWLGLGVACLLSAGVAALLAFGVSGGDDKPEEAYVFIPPVVTFKDKGKGAPLPPATTIGPGASNLSLDQALAGAPSGGTIKVKAKEGGWVTPRVVLEFGKSRSNGRVTVAGEGKDVVITRRDGGPLFRLRDADSFVLKDVTLDGGGKWGPLIEIEGRAGGVTFQNVKIVNARGEIVRLIGAQGEYTRPVHFEGVHFPAGTGVAFRARSVNDVCRNVELIGCHFEGGAPGVLVASQVETVRVRECSFGNGQYGVKFGPLPTIDGDAADPVTDWQLAGWFPQDKVPSFTPDGLPNPRELSGPWKEARADSGAIHLDRLLGKRENVTAVAYAQFVADAAGNRRIFVGADDEVKVWVNGQLVLDYGGHQGFLPRDLTAVATFRKGANHIWVQVTNGASASAFSVHVGKGYSPLAAPSWKDVTIANNTFDGLSKAVLMLVPPAPGSRVQITGNRFRKIQHYPVVVAKGKDGLMPGTVLSSANTDQEPPPQRKSFDDKLAYHLIPLGG